MILPLEQSAGDIRTHGPTLTGAADDVAAARQFLNEFLASPHTLRRYATEITRLFLWAETRSKTVSQLTRADYDSYGQFLADPQPTDYWCGPPRPRHHPQWRPFVRRLSSTSIRHAIAVVQSMLAYWVQDGYLMGNPLALKRLKATHRPRSPEGSATAEGHFDSFFDAELREALEATIESMPRETRRAQAAYRQVRWLYWLLMSTGCRIGEVAEARHGDFIEKEEGWWLRVMGKGRKPRWVPISRTLMRELCSFRKFHGLTPFPGPDDETPLLPPLYLIDLSGQPRSGILPRQVNKLLKTLMNEAAHQFDTASPAHGARLRRASAHWFRHTLVTRLVENDVPVKSIMKTTGHSDERTFRRYNQRLRERHHRDVTGVFDESLGSPRVNVNTKTSVG